MHRNPRSDNPKASPDSEAGPVGPAGAGVGGRGAACPSDRSRRSPISLPTLRARSVPVAPPRQGLGLAAGPGEIRVPFQ